jgi:hypothetical protein
MPTPGGSYGWGAYADTLDLKFDATSRFMKRLPDEGNRGCLSIDDFGWQLVLLPDLLNAGLFRSKESRLFHNHNGKKFDIPFDELGDFFHESFLDKLLDAGQAEASEIQTCIDPPSMPEFVSIFQRVCKAIRSNCPMRFSLPLDDSSAENVPVRPFILSLL